MLLVSFFTVCTVLSAYPFSWGALSDTRVSGMPFLENMTHRICFIVELFLSGTRITSGQPEKESTRINKGYFSAFKRFAFILVPFCFYFSRKKIHLLFNIQVIRMYLASTYLNYFYK